MARRGIPEADAGSMADIAFLLLIFFLVTTTIETDAGIDRKLPPIDNETEPPIIRQKNIFTVLINKNDQLLVEDKLIELKDLRATAMDFLDNGGSTNDSGDRCDYCKGKKDSESSDHPDKAIISLKNDRETKYGTYLAVQNELVGAYNDLRNRESNRIYGKDFTEMNAEYTDPKTKPEAKAILKPKIERIKKLFPQKLSEAETESRN